MRRIASVLVLVAVVGSASSQASAQAVSAPAQKGWTPEGYLLQVGVGAYRPNPGSVEFDRTYPGDNGPIVLAEFDFFLYRIPFVGPIGLGIGGGWAGYKGFACEADTIMGNTCAPSTQSAKFSLFPLNAMAVLRIDALSRKTPVPLVFTGKVGFNTVFYNEDVGAGKQGGTSYGFGWAAQIAFELNFVNPRRANALDEDWGINSSYFFFELAGSDANNGGLQVGDTLYFTGGVGITF